MASLGTYQTILTQEDKTPRSLPLNIYGGATLRFVQVTYTLLGTEANTETVDIANLVKGEIVVPELSYVVNEDCGTALTITIGDDDTTADADRYATAINLGSASTTRLSGGVASLTPYALTGDCYLKATFGSVNTLTAGAKITFKIAIASNI